MSGSASDRWELTAGQLGMWRAQQLDPANPIYNVGEYLEIQGDLDTDLFEQAIRRATNEAESLHTHFSGDDETLRQQICVSDDWSVESLDVSAEPDPRSAAERWMWADLQRPVDLRNDPLVVHAVFRAGHNRVFWYLKTHHIAGDAYSGALLVSRVAEIYTALLAGASPEEGRLEPFSTLLDAESSYRSSDVFDKDREFWGAVFAEPSETVSLSGRRASGTPHELLRHLKELQPADAASLKVAARRLRTSFPVLVIAAAAAYQHRLTGAENVVLGLPVHGRMGGAQRRAVGMTANILPIRLTVRAGMTVEKLVQQVSATVRQSLRHQRYRYEDILRDLRLVGSGGLFSLIVNIISFDYGISFGECEVLAHALSGPQANDLSICVYDRSPDGSLKVALDANPALYDAEANERNLRRFREVLLWIANAVPEQPIGAIDVLDEAERQQVLTTWNDTAREVPTATLPQLFQAQATRTPKAVAVTFEGTQLTYAELNARANRLAHLLISHGAGVERTVGLLLERS
ncbi:condensation domain-containing protein, partial [Kitasatospora sp. NPDC052896]|uniref:condensation domain-containing protein n=1 Tax=Kitasatospora sp. NPDC052896 TaxID=3364061 RepID=UPI0037C60BEF